MTTHIFVLLLNCSAIIFFFFWRPLLHLTFLPYLAGKPFFPLSPSPALKFWLLFISLICARKGSRGLVIMDTDFRGVSFHAIKILPLPPPRKCIKKKERKERVREQERKFTHWKSPFSQARVGTTMGHEKMDRVIVLFSDPQTGRAGVPLRCRGGLRWPFTHSA